MLSDPIFAAGWTVLQDRFNRTFTTQTIKIYRDILNGELSDAQFQDACRVAFRFETYFPTPQKLIEYGYGGHTFAALALERWDDMMARLRAGERATENQSERRLLMLATNGQDPAVIPHERLHWVQKEWLERYAADQMQRRKQDAAPALVFSLKELPDVAS